MGEHELSINCDLNEEQLLIWVKSLLMIKEVQYPITVKARTPARVCYFKFEKAPEP